jgi:hypothetical protein
MAETRMPLSPCERLEEELCRTLMDEMALAIERGQKGSAERILQTIHSLYRPARPSAVILRPDFTRKRR